jgi:multiple antibiotic resistance protein
MDADKYIQTSLYFLAFINPASKVFLLSSIEPAYPFRTLARVSAKATLTALLILLSLSTVGHFLFERVFRVEIYSLQVAGGIVLFLVGLTAVRKGRFYEQDVGGPAMDISVVPLGAPLIAGPGTIAASISFASTHGVATTVTALVIALSVNFLVMLSSLWLGRVLSHAHVLGPLIRITGLVVASIAIQMVLGGISQWLEPIIRVGV